MGSIRTVCAVCVQNLRKWAADYRMWTIAALLIILVQIYVDDMQRIAGLLGTRISMWIFPFLYVQFYTKVIFTLPVLLMFCNAPFTDKNQIFVYTRISRAKWLAGQVLYIFAASAVYYLFILFLTFISTVFTAEPSLEWGRTLCTIANSGIADQADAHFVRVPNIILEYFSPVQATLFTFLTSWLSAALLGLIVFFVNLLSGTRFLGIIMSSLLVVWSVLVENGGWIDFKRFSPISWNTLNNIDVGKMTSNPTFDYCMFVYAALIVMLTAGIILFGRKKNIDVKEG